ncbi:MAG TPA: alpha/beta hydrolase [Thermoleophilaceae bacterium]|nr:alpha/beta hydrolase [Thermoleophilaceae bacterium]
MIAVKPVSPGADYEGSRALLPREDGFVERDGVRTFYEVYGTGATTVLLLPTWSIVHSRIWRNQIAYLARHFRVVVFDGRGNGRSDRPLEPAAYMPHEFAFDALAVLDATGTDRVVSVSLSAGTAWNALIAAHSPDRVIGASFIGPTLYAVGDPFPDWAKVPYNEELESYDGFAGQNRYFIRDHYHEFSDVWARICLSEPHSSRGVEFSVGMSLETTPEVIEATLDASDMADYENSAERLAQGCRELRPLVSQLPMPVQVIVGENEQVALPHWGRALADDTGGEFELIPRAGHAPGRKAVRFNLALRSFAERVSG